jgi:hypothetical protein
VGERPRIKLVFLPLSHSPRFALTDYSNSLVNA